MTKLGFTETGFGSASVREVGALPDTRTGDVEELMCKTACTGGVSRYVKVVINGDASVSQERGWLTLTPRLPRALAYDRRP